MALRRTFSFTRTAQDLHNARLLKGKRLSGLVYDQYYFADEKTLGDIDPIEWRFGEQEILSMYLLSDGERVGADLYPTDTPAAFEIEPDVTCAWKREDLLATLSIPCLEGEMISEVEGILDSFCGKAPRLVGFKVQFESGDFLVFLNCGDNAVMLVNALPPTPVGVDSCFVTSIQ